tara:strand:+ start:3304 stop:3921 length:618 start_codon:yes stop_codon:yes gene_type:complete
MTFSENQIYLKSSKFSAKIINKFLKRFYKNLEKLEVLDFGCGPCTIHKFLNFKKVFLYDKEFFAIPNKNRKYVRFNNYNSILKSKQKYDLIIINSVIQYIAPNFLFNLINSLNKKLKKNGVIFLGDVPRIYRFLEFINCTNLIKIYYLVRYFLFKKEYFKKEYYLHDKSFFMKKFAKSKLIFLPSNSYFFKKRYCLIVKKYNENK